MLVRTLFATTAILLAPACSPKPAPQTNTGVDTVQSQGPTPPPAPSATGSSGGCDTASDCSSGEVCSFAAGCDARGTCVTADPQCANLPSARPYCGCDGKTFYNGECPITTPYKSSGECAAPDPSTKKCQSNADCSNGRECTRDGVCSVVPPSGLNAPPPNQR